MRERWQIISDLWEEHKARANKLNLLERLDYHRELSSQLEWQRNPDDRPIRVVYSSSGVPTAALLQDDSAIVENVCFGWLAKTSRKPTTCSLSSTATRCTQRCNP